MILGSAVIGQDKLLYILQFTLPSGELQYMGEIGSCKKVQYMGKYGDSKDELETNFHH